MSTNVSLANPGISLNFDGQALQNQQEAELDREEQLQQHELRKLLSSAFDDLDDDILSGASSDDDTVNSSQFSTHQHSFAEDHNNDNASSQSCADVATLSSHHALWSSTDQKSWNAGQAWTAERKPDIDSRSQPGSDSMNTTVHSSQTYRQYYGGSMSSYSSQAAVTAATVSWPAGSDDCTQQQQQQQTDAASSGHLSDTAAQQGSQRQPFFDAGDWGVVHEADFGASLYPDFLSLPQPSGDRGAISSLGSHSDSKLATSQTGGRVDQGRCPAPAAQTDSNRVHWHHNASKPSIEGELNHYAVTYNKPNSEEEVNHYTVMYRKPQPTAGTGPQTELGQLHHNFISQDYCDEGVTQLSQLRILYEARGRQLEDLGAMLEQQTQDASKELRRLKHLLHISNSEKEGMELSWKQSQRLLQELQDKEGESSRQVQATQQQVSALTAANTQLAKKVQSAETTIESLTHQLAGLQSTDSLTLARQQHEAVVGSLHTRHEQQIYHLKQQLDQAREDAENKGQEVDKLQSRVRQMTKEIEEAQLARGDTVSQLTRRLEESQRRSQALLESASGEESSKLRAQLQQALLSRKMADDMCASLKKEVEELREEVTMLESAASLGALYAATPAGNFSEDSIAELGIRKTLDFSTSPTTARFEVGQPLEELVGKLRQELERCVAGNKEKRSRLAVLQEEKSRCQLEAQRLELQLQEANSSICTLKVKLTAYEERMEGRLQPSAIESRLKRDIDNLNVEKQAVAKDLQDYRQRLEEVSANEEKLVEMNSSLRRQLSDLVAQHDDDMQQTLERCRRVCEDTHKAAREKQEHDLKSQHFADKQDLIMKHQAEMTTARRREQELGEELDKVKELYVQACEELRQLQTVLQAKESDLQHLLDIEKSKWEAEQDGRWQSRMEKEKTEWAKARQTETDQQLQIERQRWQEELRAQWDIEKQRLLAGERQQAELETESRWAERLEKEHLSWQVKADKEALEQADMAVDTARRQWQADTQRQLADLTRQLEECREHHQAQLAAMETQWKQEVEKKEAELEQHLQVAVGEEVSSRLTQQREQLVQQAADRLHRELNAAEEHHRSVLENRLIEEKERWLKEAEKVKLQALEVAQSQWQQQQANSVTQEVLQCKKELQRLQTEVEQEKEAWQTERSRLLAEKEEERRQAVTSARAECQADLQRFMVENKTTLDSALDSARKRHQQQLAEMESRYKEQIAALCAIEQELRAAASKNEKGADKSSLQHQVERLRREVEKRDDLLQQADRHMETEVQRLKDSLAEAYQRQGEKETLRLQAQHSHALAIAHKERMHLQRQVEMLAERLQRQEGGEEREARAQQEKKELLEGLKECQASIAALTVDRDASQQQVAALHKRCDVARQHAHKAESALKAINQQHKADVDALNAQHQETVAALTTQLAQLRKQQALALEEQETQHQAAHKALAAQLHKQHSADMQALMEELQRQTRHALSHTPTQTDVDETLCSLKDQYYHTVQKIKEEVMDHISHSNERAAAMMKTEIRQERQRTIQHLRQRCKVRVRQLLERYQANSMWTLLDQTLDSVFESVSSSRSATPSTMATTPRSSTEGTSRDSTDSLGEVGLAGANNSSSSVPESCASTSRYSLPAALRQPELSIHTDPQTSGVYYSLVPDDTASVTDSELDAPINRSAAKRVAFDKCESQTRPSTPPRAKAGPLSVFVESQSQQAALLSPKLHSQQPKERVVADETSSVWKEVDGAGWTAAVGGSNLWQAFNDLYHLEEQNSDSRRQLRFASQTFLDRFADTGVSHTSTSSKVEMHKDRSRSSSGHRHANGVLSKSMDAAQLWKWDSGKNITNTHSLIPERDAATSSTRQRQAQGRQLAAEVQQPSNPDSRQRDGCQSQPASQQLKDHLSEGHSHPGSRSPRRPGQPERVESMLKRLSSQFGAGVGGAGGREEKIQPGGKEEQSQPASSGTRGHQARSRTHSADTRHMLGPTISLTTPQMKGGRSGRGREGDLLQRSVEDKRLTDGDGLAQSKKKFSSEQALHLLGQAGGSDYSYTPLHRFLPPPSPSTSLLSTYSASEGDLRLLPTSLAWNSEFF